MAKSIAGPLPDCYMCRMLFNVLWTLLHPYCKICRFCLNIWAAWNGLPQGTITPPCPMHIRHYFCTFVWPWLNFKSFIVPGNRQFLLGTTIFPIFFWQWVYIHRHTNTQCSSWNLGFDSPDPVFFWSPSAPSIFLPLFTPDFLFLNFFLRSGCKE